MDRPKVSAIDMSVELSAEDRAHLEDLREHGQIRSIESIYGKSILDPNPAERGLDAASMLKMGISPMEFLYYVMIGIIVDATSDQISSAKTLISYYHSPQPTKVKTEVSYDRKALELANFFQNLTTEQLQQIVRRAEEEQSKTVH